MVGLHVGKIIRRVWLYGRVVGSLQIRHSQESDEGKYECVAENSAGVAYSYAANLYVRGHCSSLHCSPNKLII